jgi:hypothetical protein
MMRTNRDRQIRHIPRGVKRISTLYMVCGILTLLTSILSALIAYNLFATLGESGGGGPGIGTLLAIVLLVGISLIGAILGLVTIAAGVGLKKMKMWGLTCAYISTGLWILFGLLIVLMFIPSLFSLPGCILSSIGALIISVSIKNRIYLDRVSHYFKDNPTSPQD